MNVNQFHYRPHFHSTLLIVQGRHFHSKRHFGTDTINGTVQCGVTLDIMSSCANISKACLLRFAAMSLQETRRDIHTAARISRISLASRLASIPSPLFHRARTASLRLNSLFGKLHTRGSIFIFTLKDVITKLVFNHDAIAALDD